MGILDALRDPQFRQDVKNNARNFGQSASNTLAGNVSAPLDLIAWALRKAGIPVPEPVGGSQWMANQGLTREVPQGAPKLAGEAFGLIAPLAGAPQSAAAIARGLRQMGDNVAAPRTMNPQTGAIVWHGSPHTFPPTKNNPLGEFDASKIGTGEGAQAYGYGHYMGGAKETGEAYRQALANMNPTAQQYLSIWQGDKNKAAAAFAKDVKSGAFGAKIDAKKMQEIEKAITGDMGSLYKVDLPDDQIAKMLDWDKPLSKQSKEVKRAIEKTRAMLPPNAMDDLGGDLSLMYGPDVSPQDFLNTWESFGQKAGGENALRQLGVPGVRYLDGGSRGAGQGSSNFVVFPGNEDILRILERNGQPLGLLK